MTTPGNRENAGRPTSTADLAAAARRRDTVASDYEPESTATREHQRDRAAEEPLSDRYRGDEAGAVSKRERDDGRPAETSGEALEPLFTSDLSEKYRSRWVSIQSSFVDDPRQAVRRGDELVAEVMTSLADTFSAERKRIEGQLDETGEGSTENLRVALRRYRSFFDRLLSL